MVNRPPYVQPDRVDRPLVAFDFDGTLTIRDSFQDFLRWRTGAFRYALGLLRLAPAALRYVLGRDRQALKEATTRVFLRGERFSEIEESAERYRRAVQQNLLRPDALARWEAWKSAGAELVIVSATPEAVLTPFASALGADRLIATRLDVGVDGRITGRFLGRNCRGPEKVRRLRGAFGEDVHLAAAYGDSDGDYDMLGLADERGLKVFRGKPARG